MDRSHGKTAGEKCGLSLNSREEVINLGEDAEINLLTFLSSDFKG